MSNRKLLVLLGVFLALFAFVFFYERHQPTSEEAAKNKKKLLDFKAEDLTTLTVQRPDLPPVTLKREGTGRWKLDGSPASPADSAAVDGLVTDLGRLEVLGETRRGFDPKEFGLDAPKATAILTFKSGAKKTVRFGKEIPGTDATAAAEGDRFGAVKFAPMAQMSKPVDEFRSKALVEVPSTEITRITIVKGATKIVLAREEKADKTPGDWRLESPVADLASQTFVEQLLSDLAGARAEFAPLPATELARVGLQPPGSVVTLQKGTEIVSNVAFGAAKAEATGKVYALRDNLVLLVDDRIQEDLGKEFTAFRELRICPVDSWSVSRVSVEVNGVRAGAERAEGDWRSGGHVVPASVPEDLVEKVARAEARRFVPKKDYAAAGIPVAKKGKMPEPLAVYEVTPEKARAPIVVAFYPAAPLAAAPVVAVEVTGRSEAMLVDRALLEDLKGLAARLRASGLGMPTPSPGPTVPGQAAPSPEAPGSHSNLTEWVPGNPASATAEPPSKKAGASVKSPKPTATAR